MKVRGDANSGCSHNKVARENLVPPIKLPLPSESESDINPLRDKNFFFNI